MDIFRHRNSSVQELGEPYERIGLWGWLGLYATGAILLVLLLTHIWLAHYASSQPITLRNTLLALRSPFVRTIDLALLLFAVVHGMLGLRKVILDLDLFRKKGALYLSWFMTAAGAALLAWGFFIFSRLSY